ncbi:histone-lysine N-methyltransferase SETMAR [Prorops nasuta]|uniref:histone-lysine N-methyltransferase SETMAR n=1 Tax=Prorops nasuta TaxID=863751 RepID=UPI0034CE3C27
METFRDNYEHIDFNVMYVTKNIPGPGAEIENFESEYCSGCSCKLICKDCICTRGSPNYVDDLIVEEKLLEPIIECNSYCICNNSCGNRLVQQGPLDCLEIVKSSKKGFCLQTNKLIRKGQFICEYAGEVIGLMEAKKRMEENKRNKSMNFVLVVFEHLQESKMVTCIDPKYFGNIGRYANHSCEPNASLVPVRIEGVVPHICLFASKNIAVGEEITFDYSGSSKDMSLSDTICHCASTNCLGFLPHNFI